MTQLPLAYSLRNLWVRRGHTCATAVGIAIVVFVLAGAQMLAAGLRGTMAQSGRNDTALLLRKGSDAALSSSIDKTAVDLVGARAAVQRGADGEPMVLGEVVVVLALPKTGQPGRGQETTANVQVRGVPDNVLQVRDEVRFVEGRPARPGTDEVVVGQRLVGRFEGLHLGGKVELQRGRMGPVVGVFEAGGSSLESELWLGLDTARSAFGRQGIVSLITARLQDAGALDGFAKEVEADRQLALKVQRESDYYESQSDDSASLVAALASAIVVFFGLCAMLGASITMNASVHHRQREIGTLRAIGFSRIGILTSFLIEASALAILGGVLGSLAALSLSALEFSIMSSATWSQVTFDFTPEPGIFLVSLVVAGVTGLIGGFLPAVQAASVSPIQAMRLE